MEKNEQEIGLVLILGATLIICWKDSGKKKNTRRNSFQSVSQTRYETHTCLIQVTVTLQRLQLLNQLFSLAYFVINLTLQVRVRLWTDKNIRKHQTTHATPNITSRPRSLCLRDVLRLFTFNIMPLRSIFLVNTNFTAIKAIFVMHAVLIRVRTAAIEANVTCLNKGLRKGRTYS